MNFRAWSKRCRGTHSVRLIAVLVGITFLPGAASAGLTETNTRGRVCRNEPCHIETFSGGYFFKGKTRPSEQGQKVKFFYKRRGRPWRVFGDPDSNKVFVSTDGTPYDRINDEHKWREHFDINGGFPHRRWILKAKFLRQEGYASSSEWVRVRVAYGD